MGYFGPDKMAFFYKTRKGRKVRAILHGYQLVESYFFSWVPVYSTALSLYIGDSFKVHTDNKLW